MQCRVVDEKDLIRGEIPKGKAMMVPTAVTCGHVTLEATAETNRLFPPGMLRGTKYCMVKAKIEEAWYDENGILSALVSVHGDRMTFEGPKGEEYIVTCTVPRVGTVTHISNVRGKMREVLREQAPGWIIRFTDYQGDWMRATATHISGRVVYYEGTLAAANLVHIKTEKGTHHYYTGRLANEKKTHSWYPNGGRNNKDFLVFYDTGGTGYGPKIRTEFYDGKVLLYSGKRGSEYKTTETTKSGEIMEFLGEKGNERKVTRRMSGRLAVEHYVGCKGEEQKRKFVEENGNTMIFKGPKGQEALTHVIEMLTDTDGCTVTHYSGTRGDEMPCRKLLNCGTMEIYEHAPDYNNNWERVNNVRRMYRVKRIIHPDGSVATRSRIEDAEWNCYGYPEDADEPEANAAKRQRVKHTAMDMWNELEQLTESGDVNERALVIIGAHFKELNSAVDASVVHSSTN